jgi:DNA repair ATPase RecN
MHPAAMAIWLDAGTAAERAAVTQALLYSLLPAVNKPQSAVLSAWSALQGVREGKLELTRQFSAGYQKGCDEWQQKTQQLAQQLEQARLAMHRLQLLDLQHDEQQQQLQQRNQRLQHQQLSLQQDIEQLNALCQRDDLAQQVMAALKMMKKNSKNQLLPFPELEQLPLLMTLLRQHADLAQICRDIPPG